mmetsp:Transcript_9681/g.14584  ORF Transcript_9681/g.14584 Transcript_9681/m.14584 type:complete len:149 (+) Transcript_9681:146-592(+)|eukprot:CAMPEP_0201547440 /NCGR_PEP_ID=MMETSP0173_2-20130828/3910_1 /ASSEMBLY_ACC=CAM_ASM_000268 /TAXON_ID=218659 /ORGANISM="Vexillifera sp., Strain DIVA3 564/2" /LENGTH=148 /DNA_ID=CAMNT_0047956489 /DNA_START=119 /DNA_END=565 /DNA_ORIENTATION=+
MTSKSSSSPPIVYLRRKESFSCAHRLHSTALSDEENAKIFGKCNHPNGHGHNYTLEVCLRGPIDPKTGMLMNLTSLKKVIEIAVMDVLDHKNIDKDVEYFTHHTSTAENLCVFIYSQIKQHLPTPHQNHLYKVTLHETKKNVASYKGE